MTPKAASALAIARVQGMKIAAMVDPPRAATGGFPYPARTCAEWKQSEANARTKPRNAKPTEDLLGREMTTAERRQDAIEGSARLKEAIQALRYPQGSSGRVSFCRESGGGKIAA